MFILFNFIKKQYSQDNKVIQIIAVIILCMFFIVGIQMGKILFTPALVHKLSKIYETQELKSAPIPAPVKEPEAVKSMPVIRPEEVITEVKTSRINTDNEWTPTIIVSLIATISQFIVGLYTAVVSYKIAVKK